MEEIWDIYDENRNLTGKTIKRAEYINKIKENEYHLVVHIWIKNDNNEWLISKRTPNKHFPLLWECTGGSALAGEESLTAALREVKEELGITLDKSRAGFIKRLSVPFILILLMYGYISIIAVLMILFYSPRKPAMQCGHQLKKFNS